MSAVKDAKQKMDVTIDHFKKELRNLRTGRANPSMLDDIKVEVYGSEMNIKSLGTVNVAEARQLVVTPFDPSTSGAIAKAIDASPLNVRASVEGGVIRIPVPSLTQEVRKEIVKHGKKKAEDAKVTIREIRRKANDVLKKQKTDGDITEDDLKRSEKQVQDFTDQHCKMIDDLFAEKEKEILSV
ncbi:MAG: ribosome recycling factor [Chlamydiales bacterium]|nr:ribosome recycling factor [Chlamydiales bacterium]